MTNIPIPQGNYLPAVRYGTLIFTAGMTPRKNGILLSTGKIPANCEPSSYTEEVQQAVKNTLDAASSFLQTAEKIQAVLSLTVYINADQEFKGHSKFADIASEYLKEQLGSCGIGARTAVGVSSLPGNAPVEISLIAAAGPKEADHILFK